MWPKRSRSEGFSRNPVSLKSLTGKMNPPPEIECMSRIGVTVASGVLALVGVEVYGIYSIRHLLDTRLTQIESRIESVRAADAALPSQVVAPAGKTAPD